MFTCSMQHVQLNSNLCASREQSQVCLSYAEAKPSIGGLPIYQFQLAAIKSNFSRFSAFRGKMAGKQKISRTGNAVYMRFPGATGIIGT